MSKATPPKTTASASTDAAAVTGPTVTVTAKADGFRRCGRRWSAAATTVPAAEFTTKQLAELKAEPSLVVAVNG